ncbi:hypothetical protein J5N97_026900 [Dioscorea zingiberensis]|uniref:Uncharacterized protein n=1 Tax=Dioscorea zingiberensis TaxID=325984 RepID=A0A9D5H795_9LILI|nr:hypothetical protein J5N97_026900 [Dioscorea zingiberensis]
MVSQGNESVAGRTQQYDARQIGGTSGINTTLDGLQFSGFPNQQIVESTMGLSSNVGNVSQGRNDMTGSRLSTMDQKYNQQYNSCVPSTLQISSSSFRNTQGSTSSVGIQQELSSESESRNLRASQQTLGNTGQAVNSYYNSLWPHNHNLLEDTINLSCFPQTGGCSSNAMTSIASDYLNFNHGGFPGRNNIMQNALQRTGLHRPNGGRNIISSHMENTNQFVQSESFFNPQFGTVGIGQGGFANSSDIRQSALQRTVSQRAHDGRTFLTSYIQNAQQFGLPGETHLTHTASEFQQNIQTSPNRLDSSLLSIGPVTYTAAGYQSHDSNQAGSAYADWNQLRLGVATSGMTPSYSHQYPHHLNTRPNTTYQVGNQQRPFLHYQEPAPQGINSAGLNSFCYWQMPQMHGISPPQPLLIGANGSNHAVQTSSAVGGVPAIQSGLSRTRLASLAHSSHAIPSTPFASGHNVQTTIPLGCISDTQQGPAASILGAPSAQAPPAQAKKSKGAASSNPIAPQVTLTRDKYKGGGPKIGSFSGKPVALDIHDKGKGTAPVVDQNTRPGTDPNKLLIKPILGDHATNTSNTQELKEIFDALNSKRAKELLWQMKQQRQGQSDHIKAGGKQGNEEENEKKEMEGFSPASPPRIFWNSRKRSASARNLENALKVDFEKTTTKEPSDVPMKGDEAPPPSADDTPMSEEDKAVLSNGSKSPFEPLEPISSGSNGRHIPAEVLLPPPDFESASYPKGWLVGKKRKLVNVDVVESIVRIARPKR